MFFKIMISYAFFTLFTTTAHSSQLETMHLLGKGEAYYLKFIKVYDASLYTQEPLGDANILSSEISKCLLLEYNVPVSSKDFIKAANTVLKRQFTDEKLGKVQNELDRLHSNYSDVKDGDNYTLCYDKSKSKTILSQNNKEIVRIQSRPFAEVYFSIWLGNKSPLDNVLRDNLLAKK